LCKAENIFVTGYAKLPKGITAAQMYKVIGLGLTIAKNSGIILDADCSLAIESGESILREILVGHNLEEVDKIAEIIESNYLGHAKKAVISALFSAHKTYKNYKDNGYIDTNEYD
jgi:hypothetical protein